MPALSAEALTTPPMAASLLYAGISTTSTGIRPRPRIFCYCGRASHAGPNSKSDTSLSNLRRTSLLPQ